MHYFCFKIKYTSSHPINNASPNNDEVIIINLVLDTFLYGNIQPVIIFVSSFLMLVFSHWDFWIYLLQHLFP